MNIKQYLKGNKRNLKLSFNSPKCDIESDIDNPDIITMTTEDLEAIVEQVAEASAPESVADVLEKEIMLSRTIYLNGAIEADTVDWVVQMIHKWNREDEGLPQEERESITIYFNSEGGEAYTGSTLLSTIENSETPITGIVNGSMCMSMGLFLWMACHYRIVTKYSHVMYHTIRAGSETKTLAEIEVTLQHYKYMQKVMDDLILRNTTVPPELLQQKRDSNLDWHITFDELKQYNFAHEYR